MKEAIITYMPNGIDWAQVPVISISEPLRPLEADVTAWAQICYTDQALELHLSTTEDEVRREENGLLGMPCRDSCLEFFIRPIGEDIRYLNYEFNSSGCMYLGFGTSPEDLIRLVPGDEKQNALFQPVMQLRSDGWDLYFRIPYTFLRQFFPSFQPVSGGTIRANFYKCGDLLAKPHYLMWNPITRKGRSLFHTPAEFGQLIFE